MSTYLRQEGGVGMQIIDMRLRPPTRSWLTKPQYKHDSPGGPAPPARIGFPRARSAQEGSMQLLLSEMDQAGIRYGVVMGRQSAEPFGKIPNSEIAELVHQHRGRFLAFTGIDVSQPTDTCLAECKRYASVPGF